MFYCGNWSRKLEIGNAAPALVDEPALGCSDIPILQTRLLQYIFGVISIKVLHENTGLSMLSEQRMSFSYNFMKSWTPMFWDATESLLISPLVGLWIQLPKGAWAGNQLSEAPIVCRFRRLQLRCFLLNDPEEFVEIFLLAWMVCMGFVLVFFSLITLT